MFYATIRSNYLSEDYTVGPHDVIIGRGKKCVLNPGNQRFKAIIQTTLKSYSDAESKVKKSEIIMEVLTQVRGDGGVGFVKQNSSTGRYTLVEEASCRISIAQAFRDALHETYKSSKKHKQMRRIERKRSGGLYLEVEKVDRSIFNEVLLPESTTCYQSSAERPMKLARSSSGMAMSQLHQILSEATTLASGENDQCQTTDIFSSLYMAFGVNVNTSVDPFEPTPLADDSLTAL